MLKYLSASLLAAIGLAVSTASALDIHTDLLIAAPAGEVWSILTETDAYPDWNPYHVQIGGRLQEGQKIRLVIHKPDGKIIRIRPRVRHIEPQRLLIWGGGVRGIFRGEHVFELIAISPTCTRLVQRETFDGVAVRFAHLNGIEEGYDAVNAALKARAEHRAVGTC